MEHSKDDLKQVFDSFDKDNSGYLDLNEVVLAAKELDTECTKQDLEQVTSYN